MRNKKRKIGVGLYLFLQSSSIIAADAAPIPVIEKAIHLTENIEIEAKATQAGINLSGNANYVTTDDGVAVTITIEGARPDSYSKYLYGVIVENGATATLDKVIINEKDSSSTLSVGLFAAGTGSKITIGDNFQIIAQKNTGDIQAQYGAEILIGNNAQVSGAIVALPNGKITIKDGLIITGANTAVFSSTNGEINIGNNAQISGSNSGNGSAVVSTGVGEGNKKITIGKNALIVNDGTNSIHGYHHFAIFARGEDSVIEVGSDSKISTKGAHQNIAILAGDSIYKTNATILLGDRVTVDTTEGGDDSLGISSTYNSSITVGNELQVLTAGNYSYGIDANTGGKVFLGSQALLETSGNKALGMYAHGPNSKITVGSDSQIRTAGDQAFGILAVIGGETLFGDQALLATSGESSHAVYVFAPNSKFTVGSNSQILTAGDQAVGILAVAGGETLLGDQAYLATSGENSHAVYANNLNSKITVGSDSQIRTAGDQAFGILATAGGETLLGDQVRLATSGGNSHAVYANDLNSKITVGSDSQIRTAGDQAYGIFAEARGETLLGDQARLATSGENSHAVYANGLISKITVGSDSQILTAGDQAYGIFAEAGGETLLGDQARLATSGENSHAVYANGLNSKITVGPDSQILTAGDQAYGIRVDAGGNVQLLGNQTIQVDLKKDSYAAYVKGVSTDISRLSADGKLIITGGIAAMSSSDVDLNFHKESNFSGFTRIEDDTSNLTLTMTDSHWNMLQNSQVNTLKLDGSTINLLPSDLGSTLTVNHLENLGGNSNFILKTNLVANTSDQLIITGSANAANHTIFVVNQGSIKTNGSESAVLVQTSGSNADSSIYSLGSGTVDVGGWQYGLQKITDNWVLVATGKTAVGASATMNTFIGGYLLNYAETQTLLQRLGDLRKDGGTNGVWAKVYGGKFESRGSRFLSTFNMNYNGFQTGYDRKVYSESTKGDFYVGGAFGYSKGNLDYGRGNGSVDSKSLSAYGTYLNPSGFYADMILKYGWMKNNFKAIDSMGSAVKGDAINTDGLGASLEIGQRFHFNYQQKDKWYIEPQAQISLQHQNGGNLVASNGLQVRMDSFDSVLGRVGINVGHEIKTEGKIINLYAKASYVHEFNGDLRATLNGVPVKASFGDSWWTYGVGVTALLEKKHNLYLDIERANGGQFTQPWAVNAGYRFSW